MKWIRPLALVGMLVAVLLPLSACTQIFHMLGDCSDEDRAHFMSDVTPTWESIPGVTSTMRDAMCGDSTGFMYVYDFSSASYDQLDATVRAHGYAPGRSMMNPPDPNTVTYWTNVDGRYYYVNLQKKPEKGSTSGRLAVYFEAACYDGICKKP